MAQRPTAFAGVDVSSKELHLAVHGVEGVNTFENTAEGRKKLLGYLKKRRRKWVVLLESTGNYGLDLALALHDRRGVGVCYVNPLKAKSFSLLRLGRAKTDRVDARMLAEMAATMDLPPWEPPAPHFLALRALTRRIRTVINDRTREKNRLAAIRASKAFPAELHQDIEEHIGQLDQRVDRLRKGALEFARRHQELADEIELLTSIRGIGEATAVELLGELKCMPRDLTPKQAVAQAGLDPRPKQSGKRDAPRHISRMGSKYLRATLFVAAVNTVHWCPEIRRFHTVLVEDRKKHRTVAYVAVSRKLLHTICGLLKTRAEFEPERFYRPRTPARAVA